MGWNWQGGHCEMGAASLGREYYFAEGTTRPGFEEWLTLQNPHSEDITVKAVYHPGEGQGDPVEETYVVAAGYRRTLYVPDEAGRDKDVSVKLTSNREFLAERPMY